ncbi:M28 family peptidase [Rufibacter glacialis]|uniref:M28 family peptidase n=1 Tax=Rufibacter glacialis TaxID=1259555 RepID=A0A5M8Q6Q0_9BACT|nr:M28 family peptidase [Rufibacter glacialis]KAA6430741.1 M28 family peptidase [Rufibacter glacialis]GGK86364.1 aminopeptidase [Rufibacter glacialis]
MNYKLLLCGALLLSGTTFAQKLSLDKDVTKSLETVKPQALKGHIQYLADDQLKGRQPGTPGYQMAVDYVVQQFKGLGVQPAGENGTYVQQVRIRKAFAGKDATLSLSSAGKTTALVPGKDFAVYPNPQNPQVNLEAPLVFAGYGITAPEVGYDDYANLDVKGKVVVILRGAPKNFHSTVAAASMHFSSILQNAVNHGAVGVIIGSNNPSARATVPDLSRGVNSVMTSDGKVAASGSFVSDQSKLFAYINAATFQTLLQGAGLDTAQVVASLKNGKPSSASLPARLQSRYTSTYQDFDSYNVVGKITGADATLQKEFVVHSAHLDHMGIGAPVKGDSIYNGAHDNASGVASVLEIARVYSQLKQKPKRSLLFVLLTAEEMGLLGSAYFAKYPTVPKQSLVANINTDMPTIIAPLLSAVALGAEHSSLKAPVAKAAAHLGIAVEADPEPDQNRFIRSDQFSFVAQGIPALHIKYGNKTPDGQNNLNKKVEVWRAEFYHKPQDELNDSFDFEAGRRYVQLNFLISYQVAQAAQRPTWNANDFFGGRYGK